MMFLLDSAVPDVSNFGQKQASAPEWASDFVNSIFSAVVFPLYTKNHV